LRGAWRQRAEPAALIRAKRLERRQVPRRRDGVRRLPNERGFARKLADAFAVAELVRPHDDRVG
jgi:hypothetical protein